MDQSRLEADPKTQDAVIRNLIVIGEAAGKVPGPLRKRHPGIPWRLMADMENFAVHEYWGVRLPTIWQTLVEDLPPLLPLLQDMLDKEPKES